jgi:hypothetical protein
MPRNSSNGDTAAQEDQQQGSGDPAADRGDPANNAGASRTSESGGRVTTVDENGNRVAVQ